MVDLSDLSYPNTPKTRCANHRSVAAPGPGPGLVAFGALRGPPFEGLGHGLLQVLGTAAQNLARKCPGNLGFSEKKQW